MKKPLICATVGRKGGTGKTTLALLLAAAYSRSGRRVLLVDLDPQGSASLALGVNPTGAALVDALDGAAPAPVRVADSLAVLPGGPELESLRNPRPLVDLLADLPEAPDVVLVDCPPGGALLDRLAMQAAAVVLACCEPHRLAIAGAARALDEAARMNPKPRRALVVGRVDERRGLDRTAPELLTGAFSVPVFTIRQDATLAAALNSGTLPPPGGRAALDLQPLKEWIDQ